MEDESESETDCPMAVDEVKDPVFMCSLTMETIEKTVTIYSMSMEQTKEDVSIYVATMEIEETNFKVKSIFFSHFFF